MNWLPAVHATLLLSSAGIAVWAAIVARGRRTVPGSAAFAWLMIAVAVWAITAALHAVMLSTPARVVLAQLQYVGIAPIAPLWLIFAGQYARSRWLADRTLRVLIWVFPIATAAMAITNRWHGLMWIAIEPIDGGMRLVYHHGPWFWIAVFFNYAAIATGTFLLLGALRRYPLPYRRQTMLIIAGVVLPWVGNALYVSGWLPPGFDLTPLTFAISGALVLWGLYRHRLLGLVPIARDIVIDNMDDGLLVLDQQRNLVDFNPGAQRLTGCTVDSIGQPIEDAVPWWTQAAAEGSRAEGLPRVFGLNGNYVEVQIKPVRDGQDRFTGWVVLVRDITARRRAETDRLQLERRVMEQQKLESLSVLAGGVAHDFNNLLTAILGNADLLSEASNNGSPLRKSAEAIVIGAQRAADLVSKMLAYAGEGRVISELIDLDQLLREMTDLLQASVARHCTLEYHAIGQMPRIHVDAAQLRQVVLNLIVNASEAVEDGGSVHVTGGLDTLSEPALAGMTFRGDATPGPYAFVEVRDTGPGIDGSTLVRIFDPFFSTKQTGRGLGLAAVQGIVRSHRGALHVITAPGRGTTFRVWFPT